MRLDRYLKISRLVKRRTLAKEVCEQGKVKVNGRTAKPGTDVKPGDRLGLHMGRKILEVEVVAVPEQVSAREAASMYRVVKEERRETEMEW